MKLNHQACRGPMRTFLLLAAAALMLVLSPASTGAQTKTEPGHLTVQGGISVGPFGTGGRGYKFSSVTLSVQALPGEAALVVKDENGYRGMSVRRDGNVAIDGDLLVYGRKQFVQAHPEDPSRLISYVSLEGPEAGTYVRGSARLIDGRAVVELPSHFGHVTAEEGLTVSVTPSGQWLELYVAERSTARIVVREAGHRSGTFDYLVQGVRKGFEDFRPVSRAAPPPAGAAPQPASRRGE